jgi:hypothetical protein
MTELTDDELSEKASELAMQFLDYALCEECATELLAMMLTFIVTARAEPNYRLQVIKNICERAVEIQTNFLKEHYPEALEQKGTLQ